MSNNSNEIRFGILGRYSYFGGTNELFLPVDTSYINSKTYTKLIEDIGPFIGFAFNFNKNLISIRDCTIFHMGYSEMPYLWDIVAEKGLGSKRYSDILDIEPDTATFEKLLAMRKKIKKRYDIDPNCYGTIEKFGFFSYGEEELILPLDFSYMKNDSIHQSIKKMLQEMNPIAGFLFNRDRSKNLLIFLDDGLFGVLPYLYEEWDLNHDFFVYEITDITDIKVERGKKLKKLTSGFLVFISYSTKDSNKFNIPYLTRELSKFPEIGKVLFWEEDMDDDIIEYMNKFIKKCDLFILICSQNALDSEPVKMEWQVALKIKKKIIPVFKNESDIPALLSTKLGIKYDENNLEKTINDLYSLILKKLKNKN